MLRDTNSHCQLVVMQVVSCLNSAMHARMGMILAILVLTVVLAGAWWVDAMELACLTIIHQVATPIYYILERAHHH